MQTIEDIKDEVNLALAILEEKNLSLLGWLESVEITDKDQQKHAEDLLIHGRRAWKEADAEEKELLQPSKLEANGIKAAFKPYKDRLTNGVDIVSRGLSEWHRQEILAAKAQRDQELAVRAEQMREAQETGEIVQPIEQHQVTPVAPKTSYTHLGSVSYVEGFDVSITNAALVPRDLCDPNLVKIRARANSGVKEIPGVLISPKYNPRGRGAK